MPASTFNFSGSDRMEAGATFDKTIELVYANGDPVDLTLYDPVATPGANGGRLRLRKTVDATATILQLNPTITAGEQGVQIVQPATLGKVRIVIDAATLASLSYTAGAPVPDNRSGVYDLETSTGGAIPTVVRWIEGSYTISPEVTRAD